MSILKNFATSEYRKHINEAVLNELLDANIPALNLHGKLDTEVKTTYVGILNGFVFTRGWRYWVCTGDMPLAHANEIHKRHHHLIIRAGGHAACPEPATQSYSPEQHTKEKALIEAMKSCGATTEEMVAELEKLVVDPAAPRFVKFYHIDTTEGLAALAAYIRKNNVFAHNGVPGSYTASVFPGGGDCA